MPAPIYLARRNSGHTFFERASMSMLSAMQYPHWMMVGGAVALFLGVAAEGKSLEDLASPLSAVDGPTSMSNITGAPRAPAARANWF